MAHQIIWSKKAQDTLHEIFYFYQPQTGNKKATEIIGCIISRVEQLALFPYSGSIECSIQNTNKVYRYLLYSHYKIYYFIMGYNIHIVAVWDTRQNPIRLWKLLP